MPGKFGRPEFTVNKTIQQAFITACQNGYIEQLHAYGVGKGLSQQEALKLMKDGEGYNEYIQDNELFEKLKKKASEIKRIDSTEDSTVVSMGANNVKEGAPTGEPVQGGKE